MDDKPSDRIIDQRCRNRIMEVVLTLAEGDEGARREGPDEYFEGFYDWIPHRNDGGMHPNSAITHDERDCLIEVSKLLDDACDATPRVIATDEFIATGWPLRIQPVARRALDVMVRRGRFSEDREEDEPSFVSGWP